MSAGSGLEHHRRRGAIAARLLEAAPDAAAALDWDALDRAPAWLAVLDTELALEQRRIGAVLNAVAIRLWIDRRKLAAARAAVGDRFLRALLADSTVPEPAPHSVTDRNGGRDIGEWLRQAGAVVQASAISDSPLGHAVGIALCGRAGGAQQLPAEAARGLIEHARRIAATLAMATPEPAR